MWKAIAGACAASAVAMVAMAIIVYTSVNTHEGLIIQGNILATRTAEIRASSPNYTPPPTDETTEPGLSSKGGDRAKAVKKSTLAAEPVDLRSLFGFSDPELPPLPTVTPGP